MMRINNMNTRMKFMKSLKRKLVDTYLTELIRDEKITNILTKEERNNLALNLSSLITKELK